MGSEKKHSTFRLPMVEMIIIIGIFSVVSLLIVKMFVSTDKLQAKAVNISRAVMEAESLAELIKGSKATDILQDIGARQLEDHNGYVLFYDKEWNQVEEENSNLIMIEYEAIPDDYGTLDTYQIIAYAQESYDFLDENVLCDLIVKKYRSNVE